MFKTKSLLLASLIGASFMSEAEADASTGGGAPETETPAAAEARKRAPAANFLPIVRGRLPLLFVHAIRFDKTLNAMGNKDLATKFGTSVGKVFDIKKGRNFGYITEGFKPTAEDIAAAESHATQVGAQNAKGLTALGDKQLLQSTIDAYKEAGLASAEEAAAQSAARTVTRAPKVPGATNMAGATSETSTATTAKPSKAAKASKGETVTASAGTADDLLG